MHVGGQAPKLACCCRGAAVLLSMWTIYVYVGAACSFAAGWQARWQNTQ